MKVRVGNESTRILVEDAEKRISALEQQVELLSAKLNALVAVLNIERQESYSESEIDYIGR